MSAKWQCRILYSSNVVLTVGTKRRRRSDVSLSGVGVSLSADVGSSVLVIGRSSETVLVTGQRSDTHNYVWTR